MGTLMPMCRAWAVLCLPEADPQLGWCSAVWLTMMAFFGYILVFPMLLLFPVWEKMSTCGEVEHECSPQHGVASSI